MGLGAVLGAGLTLVLGGMMQVVTRAVPGPGVPAGLLPLVLPLVYTFFAQQLMLPIWPPYAEYQTKTDREIPVVLLRRKD